VQLVLCLLSTKKKDRYDAIKKTCCVDYHVPSQIFTTRELKKSGGAMSVCTNFAIQLNCQLIEDAGALDIPVRYNSTNTACTYNDSGHWQFLLFLQVKKLMVIGFDTYHDSTKTGLSVGALVGSLNDTLRRYYSRVSLHGQHEEVATNLYTHVVGM